METALGVGRRPPAFWASTGLKATLSAVVELAEYPTFLKSSDSSSPRTKTPSATSRSP